jgi:hypothetical protein
MDQFGGTAEKNRYGLFRGMNALFDQRGLQLHTVASFHLPGRTAADGFVDLPPP